MIRVEFLLLFDVSQSLLDVCFAKLVEISDFPTRFRYAELKIRQIMSFCHNWAVIDVDVARREVKPIQRNTKYPRTSELYQLFLYLLELIAVLIPFPGLDRRFYAVIDSLKNHRTEVAELKEPWSSNRAEIPAVLLIEIEPLLEAFSIIYQ